MGHGHSHDDLFASALDRLHDLFAESEQPMYVFLDDHMKACNPRFAKLLGYKDPSEFTALGNVPASFVADDSIDTVIQAFQDAVGKGVASDVAVSWRSKAGKPVKTRTIFVPFDHEGHRMALHFVRPA